MNPLMGLWFAPDPREPLKGKVDDDGHLDLRLDAQLMNGSSLRVSLDGCADVLWPIGDIAPGEQKILGTIQFEPECSITGRIVGPDGDAFSAQSWQVTAWGHGALDSGAGTLLSKAITVDEGARTFTMNGLPAGHTHLSIQGTGMAHAERFDLLLVEGDALIRDFATDLGAQREGRIMVVCGAWPLVIFEPPALDLVKVTAADGTEVDVTHPTAQSVTFYVDTDSEGPFTLSIADPRFEAFKKMNVRKGDLVVARLVGTARLALDVRDANGQRVEQYTVDMALPGFLYNRHLRIPWTMPVVGGTLDGVPPGTYEMVIESSAGVARLDGVEFVAGKRCEVMVKLARAQGIDGTVTFPKGDPAAETEVVLLRPAEDDDSRASPIAKAFALGRRSNMRKEVARATCDADGRFSLAAPEPGPYAIAAYRKGKTWVISDVQDVGEDVRYLDLALPAGAVLSGIVEMPQHLPALGWELFFVHVKFFRGIDGLGRAPVLDSRAAFEVAGLRAGLTHVYIRRPTLNGVVSGGDGRPFDGYLVGSVQLEEGGSHHVKFGFEGSVPSRVTPALTSKAALSGGVVVSLTAKGERTWHRTIDLHGRGGQFESAVIAPGRYDVKLSGDDWAIWSHPPVEIGAGQALSLQLKVNFAERRLRIFREGEPAAGAKLLVKRGTSSLKRFDCDAEGWVTLRLDAGPLEIILLPEPEVRSEKGRSSIEVNWPMESEAVLFTAWFGVAGDVDRQRAKAPHRR